MEIRQRDRTASWTQTLYDATDPIEINPLNLAFQMDDIYEDTDF